MDLSNVHSILTIPTSHNSIMKDKSQKDPKLKFVFDKVLSTMFYSTLIQRSNNGRNCDGRNFWQPIKKKLKDCDSRDPLDSKVFEEKIEWKKGEDHEMRHRLISELQEFMETDRGTKEKIESNYFLMKVYSIMSNEKP